MILLTLSDNYMFSILAKISVHLRTTYVKNVLQLFVL
jgi:hypothetical protein